MLSTLAITSLDQGPKWQKPWDDRSTGTEPPVPVAEPKASGFAVLAAALLRRVRPA